MNISRKPGLSGSCIPLPVSKARMAFISSSVRVKSKISILLLIRSGFVDFGNTMMPSWFSKRKMT